LGKWILVDNNGEFDNNVFFIIYNDGNEYKALRKYYMNEKFCDTIWKKEYSILRIGLASAEDFNIFFWSTVGKPQWNGDTYVVLIDNEGPLGFFQRVIE
jgi:hypothetical protein